MLTRSPICCPTFSSVRPICGGIFDFDTRSTRLAAVVRELENPRIWEDQKRAQELGKEKKQLDGVVGTLIELDGRLKDSTELFELARGEEDDATLDAVAADAAALQRKPVLHRHSGGERRHRGAGLGVDAAAHVHSLL